MQKVSNGQDSQYKPELRFSTQDPKSAINFLWVFFQNLDYLGFLHNGYQCILVQYLRLNRLTIRMLKYNKDPPLIPGPYCVAGRTWRNWTALSRGGRTCQDVIQSCLYSEYTLFLIQFYLALAIFKSIEQRNI